MGAKVLVTGKGGKTGSWVMRGEQLGKAIGATVKPNATRADLKGHDVVVIVKRMKRIDEFKGCGVPVIWDMVDNYPQNAGMDGDAAISHMASIAERIGATHRIAATERMREDTGADIAIKHHHWQTFKPNPIREKVERVGYQGGERYILRSRKAIESVCREVGAEFVVNPSCLSDVDVVLCWRDEEWRSYPVVHWKSGVKLNNAQATGTPVICNMECGYLEQATGGERWAQTISEFRARLELLRYSPGRRRLSKILQSGAFPLEAAADQMKTFCNEVADTC